MEIGWLLHPSLVPTSSFRVADIGTGTAIWALDLAQSFSVGQVDGFDIDLEQCPPSEWLPPNITVREWDAFSALPPELENQYDVVHIRLMLLVVPDNDPRLILRNSLLMLKKGGCLQWEELDPWGAYVVETGMQEPDRTRNSFQRAQEWANMATLQWVTELTSIMEEMGFEEIKKEEIVCDIRLSKYYQDSHMMLMEELAANQATGDKRKIVDTIQWLKQNAHRGKARVPSGVFFFEPFTGHGIMTADGPFWNRSRNLLKPTFSRAQISDHSQYSVHIDNLLTALLKDHHSFVDLKSYFENLALDSSTEFLFGHNIGSLTPNTTFNAWTFIQAYNIGQAGIGKRMQLPHWNFLTRDKRFWRSCSIIRGFVEQFVDYASASRKDPSYQASNRLVLVHQLSDETPNRKEIVSQLLNVFLPAHDATAIALTNIFFHLSRHPSAYATLRREILDLGPQADWTFERLKACKYLQAVMNETFRLNPPIGQMSRAALRDSVLPTGGGDDGAAPVFVKKGTVLTTSFYALHRSREQWGEDAEDWRPERWLKEDGDGLRKVAHWTFLPFGGGPRVCIGMQLALTEVGYAVGRMVEQFRAVECRDPVWEFVEEWKLSTVSRNGAKVKLVEA
ncbi:MAG: hypothetical protein Q9194_005930 [Teloschistes cf. exilis]